MRNAMGYFHRPLVAPGDSVMKHVVNFMVAAGTLLATVAHSGACQAFHGQTAHAWKRTFYAYNALDRPLRPYFVPRRPGDCGREAFSQAPGCAYPPSAAMGFEPVQFERLGHIPNDVGAGPAAASR